MKIKPLAKYLRRQKIPFDRLNSGKNTKNRCKLPNTAAVRERKRTGEENSQNSAHIRDGVEKAGDYRDTRPGGNTDRPKGNGVHSGHDKTDQQLAADIGFENAARLVKQPAERVTKARRYQFFERFTPSGKIDKNIKDKKGYEQEIQRRDDSRKYHGTTGTAGCYFALFIDSRRGRLGNIRIVELDRIAKKLLDLIARDAFKRGRETPQPHPLAGSVFRGKTFRYLLPRSRALGPKIGNHV